MTEAPPKKRHRWTKANLQAQVDKLDDEVEIYWDYRDELGKDDIAKIVNEGLEGLDEVEMSLRDLNAHELFRLRDEAVEAAVERAKKISPMSDRIEKQFRQMIEDSDKLLESVDIKGLARHTTAYFTISVNDIELSYQAYRGVESAEQVREFCKMFDLLGVNPGHFQKWVTADNENRPSYDPEPVVFPDHPERDGGELVTVESVHDIMNETNYGGTLLFLLELKVSDLIENLEAFTKGPITVHKGTWCFPYCFMNGAGPCAEMILQKDLVLPAGSFTLHLDSHCHYGVQSCYGFTEVPWRAGNITPAETPAEEQAKIEFPPTNG